MQYWTIGFITLTAEQFWIQCFQNPWTLSLDLSNCTELAVWISPKTVPPQPWLSYIAWLVTPTILMHPLNAAIQQFDRWCLFVILIFDSASLIELEPWFTLWSPSSSLSISCCKNVLLTISTDQFLVIFNTDIILWNLNQIRCGELQVVSVSESAYWAKVLRGILLKTH